MTNVTTDARETLHQRITALQVATTDPAHRAGTMDTATDAELIDVLVTRGILQEEWFVGLHSVRTPGDVLGRWVMSSEAQAQGVARDWREDSGANYVVERHLGCATFVIVPPPTDSLPDDAHHVSASREGEAPDPDRQLPPALSGSGTHTPTTE